MTLATILCASILCGATATPVAAAATRGLLIHDASQSSATGTPATSSIQTQDQATPAGQNQPAPSTTPATKAPANQNGANKPPVRRRHKKKTLPLNCNPATPAAAPTAAGSPASGSPASGSPVSGSPASSSPSPGSPSSDSSLPSASAGSTPPSAIPAGNTPAATPAGNAPANCPPERHIVPNGGVPDPTVQLAGGSGPDKASQDSANQMLTATERNLKKLEGRTLSPNERDVVKQIRGFMTESKTAADAGDAARARTLAWKAQLLSEDLVKPKQ